MKKIEIIIADVKKLPKNNKVGQSYKIKKFEKLLKELKKENRETKLKFLYHNGKLYEYSGKISKKSSKIRVLVVKKTPKNEELGWEYPLDELDHLFEQIEDDFRSNNSIMYYYKGYLCERTKDIGDTFEISIEW